MPTIKFTTRSIGAIKRSDVGRAEYWDKKVTGFGLRVSGSGQKTWIAMYRHAGRLRRLTIGTYPTLSLADAREKAKAALREAAGGGDPATSKRRLRGADTFGDLAENYIEQYAKAKKKTWRLDRNALDRDLLPRFRNRKANSITRGEVRELLREIVARGAPIGANRTLEIMRKIYNWGLSQEVGDIQANPCSMIEPPGEEQQRDRVLTDVEIRAVWAALEEDNPDICAIFKLRLLTAQRGGEMLRMRWSDIDEVSSWWTIPGEFTKNGLSHRVPLSPSAVQVLEGLGKPSGEAGWVFPSPTGMGQRQSVSKAIERIRARSNVDFVPHDLRRTVASRLTGDLGIGRLTVAKILNHVETGVTAVYDRHSYDAEKKQALDAWGFRLEAIVSGQEPASKTLVRVRHAR